MFSWCNSAKFILSNTKRTVFLLASGPRQDMNSFHCNTDQRNVCSLGTQWSRPEDSYNYTRFDQCVNVGDGKEGRKKSKTLNQHEETRYKSRHLIFYISLHSAILVSNRSCGSLEWFSGGERIGDYEPNGISINRPYGIAGIIWKPAFTIKIIFTLVAFQRAAWYVTLKLISIGDCAGFTSN